MPTFIDESGDTGHGLGAKSYFRLAAVWLPSIDDAEAFRESIRKLRRDLGRKQSYEFKFAKTGDYPDRRRRFFETALQAPFRFAVSSIDKTAPYWRTAPSHEQHWAAATAISVDMCRVYHEAERPERPLREPVFVDQNNDRRFLDAIKTAFQSLHSQLHPGVSLVVTPKFRKSHADEVMQLADMVCGAVGASFENDNRWLDMIITKCQGITPIP